MLRKQCSWCTTLVYKVNKVYGIYGPIYLCTTCTRLVAKQIHRKAK